MSLYFYNKSQTVENWSNLHMNITENGGDNLLADDIATIVSTLERSLSNEVVQNQLNTTGYPTTHDIVLIGPYIFACNVYMLG